MKNYFAEFVEALPKELQTKETQKTIRTLIKVLGRDLGDLEYQFSLLVEDHKVAPPRKRVER